MDIYIYIYIYIFIKTLCIFALFWKYDTHLFNFLIAFLANTMFKSSLFTLSWCLFKIGIFKFFSLNINKCQKFLIHL